MELERITADFQFPVNQDLALIESLWKQDEDLGVGKEVYDANLRQEIEIKRKLELQKQQEWEKCQLQLREKQEKEKQELAERWLKENYSRDGETGEWIPNQSGLSSLVDNSQSEDSLTLEAALDFLSSNFDHSLLQNLEVKPNPDPTSNVCNQYTDESYLSIPETQDFEVSREPISHQDSLEENWNGLLDYFNHPLEEVSPAPLSQFGFDTDSLVSDIKIDQDIDAQNDYLIQNVTMQSDIVANETNSLFPYLLSNNTDQMNFDFDGLNFLNSLSSVQSAVLDLVDDSDLFSKMPFDASVGLLDVDVPSNKNVDNFTLLEDDINQSVRSMSPYDELSESLDGLEGAIGGSELNDGSDHISGAYTKISRLSESSNDSGYAYQGGFSSSSPASSNAGSPAGYLYGNTSTSSNDTELDPHSTQTLTRHAVAHNHTYNTPPGQVPREVKKYSQKDLSRKGLQSRDQKRAEELKIPFTIDEIIDSPVETFNEMLTNQKLTEAQLSLIRDIRRRGKNKIAAQNCRKRKVNVIVNLSDEMTDLQKARDRLLAERADMEKERRIMKDKFGSLYTQIFQSLRDERGQPYDPNYYSLQQTSDGNVFLVPRNVSVANNKYSTSSSASSSPSSSKDSVSSKKRKSFDD